VAAVTAPGFALRLSAQPAAHTGLILLVRGIHLDRSISLAVLTPSGEVVYGRVWWKPGQLNVEIAENSAFVEYASSLANANRAGSYPLVVRAIGVSGVVVQNGLGHYGAATRCEIREANGSGRFSQQMRVTLVSVPIEGSY
jgi:hypothetical protein